MVSGIGRFGDRTKAALWWLWLRASSDVGGKLAALRRFKEAGAEAAERRRRERLADLLRHAAAQAPFWRDRLARAGVVKDGSVRLDAFADIPLLTRADLREHGTDMRARGIDPRACRTDNSSGSTGEPIRVLQDRGYLEWNRATKLFFDELSGYRPGMAQVRLWGLAGGASAVPLRMRLGRWLRNERWLDSMRMSPTDMRRYVAEINRIRPCQIHAYVESLFDLARFVEAEGLSVPPPETVVTSAGTLTDAARTTIARVFRAPVLNRYGAVETGDIASERPGGAGLLVVPSHHVEILRADGRPAAPGELGEVVVTVLTGRAMPLIRYRIGDLSAFASEPASDAPGWPVLERVAGRTADSVVAADGSRIHAIFFDFLLEEHPFVRRFQIDQPARDRLVVQIVARDGEGDPAVAHAPGLAVIRTRLAEAMGPGCTIELRLVDTIAPAPSGKFRMVTSALVGA